MKNRKVRTSFPFLSFPLIILPFPLYAPYVLKSDTMGLSRTGARFRISWPSIVSGSPLISPNENETCAPPSALRNNNSSIPNSSSFSISQVPEKFSENLSRSRVVYPACERMPKGIIEINSKIDEKFDLKIMALGELFCCIVKPQCFIFEPWRNTGGRNVPNQLRQTTSFTCCAHDHFVGSCARPLRATDALRPPACGPALAGSGRRFGHIFACA